MIVEFKRLDCAHCNKQRWHETMTISMSDITLNKCVVCWAMS
jgi:NAD-dependent SIR2 family protein deacetylase